MTTIDDKRTPPLTDWHPADIICALTKAGWSLRRLGVAHGYSPGSLSQFLRRQNPRAEAVIASALGLHPSVIWQSRYNPDGTPAGRFPNDRRGRPKLSEQHNSAGPARHVNVRGRR